MSENYSWKRRPKSDYRSSLFLILQLLFVHFPCFLLAEISTLIDVKTAIAFLVLSYPLNGDLHQNFFNLSSYIYIGDKDLWLTLPSMLMLDERLYYLSIYSCVVYLNEHANKRAREQENHFLCLET